MDADRYCMFKFVNRRVQVIINLKPGESIIICKNKRFYHVSTFVYYFNFILLLFFFLISAFIIFCIYLIRSRHYPMKYFPCECACVFSKNFLVLLSFCYFRPHCKNSWLTYQFNEPDSKSLVHYHVLSAAVTGSY